MRGAIRGGAAVLLAISGIAFAQHSTMAVTRSGSALPANVTHGQQVFLQNCAMCHGDGGLGDGEMAAVTVKQAGVHVANLTDRAEISRLGRAGVRRTVTLGGAHNGLSNLMPAWGGKLSSREIEDVTDFVMRLPDLPGTSSATLRAYSRAPSGTPALGQSIFIHQCSACHGVLAHGDGPLAASLIRERHVHPRNLTDASYIGTKTDRELFTVISEGGGSNGKSNYMPHWGGYLTPAQIKDLVSYIRSISHTESRP
jgi:mono/diheme cytochrome c family protein